jgi:hypothetical protein
MVRGSRGPTARAALYESTSIAARCTALKYSLARGNHGAAPNFRVPGNSGNRLFFLNAAGWSTLNGQ